MPRFDKSAREILNGRRYATLATHNEDGSIHTTQVWYVFENESLYVGSPSLSRKAREVWRLGLMRRSWSTFANQEANAGFLCRGVQRFGEAMNRERSIQRILRRYLTNEAMAGPRVGPAFAAADDITICLKPESLRLWSSKDVDDQFFGGLLREKWFRR